MRAILNLVVSKNPPVIPTPALITYARHPKVGESFYYVRGMDGWGYTSTVQKVEIHRKFTKIFTLNSVYSLTEKGK